MTTAIRARAGHDFQRLSRSEGAIAIGSFLTFFLLLLANVLILPPYEGFDEPGHYSYISYLSDQHQIPDLLKTPYDATIEQHRAGLPRPYTSWPPYEENGGLTYSEFFETVSETEREQATRLFWTHREVAATFSPDRYGPNPLAGHPPLYYALMVLPYRLTADWSPGATLLTLRLVSIIMAAGSFFFFWRTIRLLSDSKVRRWTLGGAIMLCYFPSLFYDLARLGNDSLCTLVLAAVFYLLVAIAFDPQQKLGLYVGLGICLGLGLISKLYFVAIAGGAILYTLVVARHLMRLSWRPVAARIGIAVCLLLLVGGWWYVFFYYRYGILFGTQQQLHFALIESPPGDLLPVLEVSKRFLRSISSAFGTFLWSGTWSFLRRPLWEYLYFVPFCLLILSGAVRSRSWDFQHKWALLAVAALLVPFTAGGFYYMYSLVKYTGQGSGLGGYYWYVAWPLLAFLFSYAFMESSRRRRSLMAVALAMLTLFELSGWWKLLLLYSGILTKVGSIKTGVGFVFPSIDSFLIVVDRLQSFSFPVLSFVLLVAALLLRSVLTACLLANPSDRELPA